MDRASGLFRLLGDEARLRLLRLLRRERLNVTELTGILGLAQSGVSRHLGLLRDAGLVAEDKEAGFTYYRLSSALTEDGDGRRTLWAALEHEFETAAGDPAVRADEARLQEVLRLRKENFDTHGGADTRDARQLVPGRSWAAWSRALGMLLPPVEVADLGCGEGYLTLEAARWASRVVAVDRSSAVLDRARALARRRRVSNVVWKRGELERLPIGDGRVEVSGAWLELRQGDPGSPERPLLNHIGVLVESVEEQQAEVEDLGVEIDNFVDAPNTLALFVWGPDRVKLEYIEHKPSFALT